MAVTSSGPGNFSSVITGGLSVDDDVIINHDVILDGDATAVNSLTINSGKTLTGGGFTITIDSKTSSGNYSLDNQGIISGELNIKVTGDGGHIREQGTGSIHNLEVDLGGSSEVHKLSDSTTITGNLTITEGHFQPNGRNLTVEGLVTNNDTFTASSGVMSFGGIRTQGTGFTGAGTVNILGTGAIIEGNLDDSNVVINLDSVGTYAGSDRVTVSHATAIQYSSNTDNTWSCWINASALGGNNNGRIFDKSTAYMYLTSDGSTGYHIAANIAHSGTNMNIKTSTSYQFNVWYHVALVYEGSGGTGEIFVNGVQQGLSIDTAGASGLSTDSADLIIGNNSGGSRGFAGMLADFKFFPSALSTELKQLSSKINYSTYLITSTNKLWASLLNGSTADSGPETNTIAYTDAPTTTSDAFSVDVYDNSTTTDGTFTVTQGKVECLALSSLDLDGTNEYVDFGAVERGTADTTVSMWINPDALNDRRMIGDDGGSGDDHIRFRDNNGSIQVKIDGNEARFLASSMLTSPFAINKWQHLTVTHDYSTGDVILYKDGVKASATGDVTSNEPLTLNWIGGNNDGEYFDGAMRDVKIFDYILSDEQVASLYSGTYLQTPLHHWKLDEGHTTEATVDASGAFADSGTGTTANGTGANLDADSCVNGTLDLNGSGTCLTVSDTGTLSAPRGNLDLNDDLLVNGTFTHNNGTVRAVSATAESMQINSGTTNKPITFYNLEANTGFVIFRGANVTYTVENILSATTRYAQIRPLDGDVSLQLGTTSSAGGLTGNAIQFTSNGTNFAEIKAASSLYPWTAATVPDFDSGGSGSKVRIADCDMDPDITTGGGGVTITLTGDCEFDAFVVSGNDTLDLNGQRATFGGGLFNNTGTLTDGGDNSLIHITGTSALRSYTGDSSTQWSFGHHNENPNMTLGNTDMIISGGAASIKMPSTANDFARTVLVSGSGAQLINSGVGFCPTNLIAASEVDTHGSNNNKIDTTNLTIPTGGTLTANASILTVAGDFTTSGGLYGASCLELNGSDESAATSSTTTWGFGDAFTIELWFKTSFNGSAYLMDFDNVGNNNNRIQLLQSASEMTFRVFDLSGSMFTTGTTAYTINPDDGVWHHLAYTNSGSEQKVYYDGRLAGTSSHTIDRDNDPSMKLTVGKHRTLGGNYSGFMEELRFFTDVRTEAEIRADMFQGGTLANSGNLSARYSFDEGSGTAVDNSQGTDGRDLVASGTGVWPTGGAFDISSGPTLKMTGTSKKIIFTGNENVGNLQISGTTTLEEINGNDGYLQFNGTLTVDASKTLASTSAERLIFNSSSDTIVINNAATGLSGLNSLEAFHTSGTVSLPACTTKQLKLNDGGTVQATGDLTLTTKLEVNAGTTFNGQNHSHTIELLESKGHVALNNGTFTITSRADADTTASWSLQNSTIQGAGSGHWWRVAHESNCELVGGTFKGFLVRNHGFGAGGGSGITVIGSVVNSSTKTDDTHPNQLIQFFHTLDTQQLLDADEAGDDDLRLTKPTLDNSHELQTG